jgi:Escherichia/Staphylococcus phage prohead protease
MNPSSARMLEHFYYAHLPTVLQSISQPIAELAIVMAENLDSDNPIAAAEVTTGLRKLLEAKDCFVRAGVALDSINKG